MRDRVSSLEAKEFTNKTNKAFQEKQASKQAKLLAERTSFYNNRDILLHERELDDRFRGDSIRSIKNDCMGDALKAIYITALEAATLTDENLALAESMVDNYIKEAGGADNIIRRNRNKSYLLNRICSLVEDAAEEETEEMDSVDMDEIEDEIKNLDKEKEDTEEEEESDLDDATKELADPDLGEEDTDLDEKDEEELDKSEESKEDNLESEEKEGSDDDSMDASSGDKEEDEIIDKAADEEEADEDIDKAEDELDKAYEAKEKARDEEESEDKDGEDSDDEEEKDEDSEDSDNTSDDNNSSDDESNDSDSSSDSESDSDNEGDSDNSEEASSDEELDTFDLDADDEEDSSSSSSEEEDFLEKDDNEEESESSEEDEESEDDDAEEDSDDNDDDSSDDLDDEDTELGDIDDSAETINTDPEDPDSMIGDEPDSKATGKAKMFEELEDEEDVRKAIDLIKDRVADAEEAFIKRNAEDKRKIDNLLGKISDNVKKVEDLSDNDSDKAKVAEEAVSIAKHQYDNIVEQKELTIYEAFVRNLTTSILNNTDVVNDYLTESGTLDMANIEQSARVMYTFLETLNTLQLEDVNSKYIEKILNEMK